MNKKLACLPLVLLFACSEPSARIMKEEEADKVGIRSAGAATFEILVTEAVSKLLDRHKKDFAVQMRRVAFVDLENKTAEELGEWREQLIDKILLGIDKHPVHRIISGQMVGAVLREMGNPPIDKLYLPKGRREFAAILEKQNVPVNYLMYGRITRGKTDAGAGTDQANYLLTLELVNIETGEQDTEGAEVRKEYRRR